MSRAQESLEITPTIDLRCSVVTRQLGERPAGSAGGAHRYLLVELPPPWPKKIDAHPLLADVGSGPMSVSILGIRAAEVPALDEHRIIWYERTEPFRGFTGRETIVPTAALTETVAAAVAADGPDDGWSPLPNTIEDVLVCTHGSRDRCCGQLGTRLHSELDGSLPSHVRIWRTSHTGGHRFAPTAIHFPNGTAWAHLTDELTRSIVRRSVSVSALADHFRGNVGISGRLEQIAEGEGFFRSGWDWLGEERAVRVDPGDDAELRAQVLTERATFTVTMVDDGSVPVPPCGDELDAAKKSAAQYRVVDVVER